MREKHLGIWRVHHLARVRRAGPARGPRAGGPRAAAAATWCRSSPTTARSGSTPISARCRWAASPTASTPPTPPRQVEYIVNDSGTRFFFAENEEQLDKILEVRARCPQLVKIFVFDMEGLHAFRDEQVMSFDDSPRARRALRPRASRRLRSPGRDRAARRPGDPRLHLGHHRPAQGRDAEPPQHPLPARLRRLRHRAARRETSSSPSCRCPTSPSGPSPSSIRCAPAPR